MCPKLLIICGPTATGKTQLALDLAKEFSGELISADSRQVYIGLDIISGKDIPSDFHKEISDLVWHDRKLTYYTNGQTRIWLLDIVHPTEDFNVSFWKECADLVAADILSRHKLPIIIGGTGLYIKTFTHSLSDISIPRNLELRQKIANLSVNDLFNYLKNLNPAKAASLNNSDSKNPRRLIRYIEISQQKEVPSPEIRRGDRGDVDKLILGLTAPLPELKSRISTRVASRLLSGAKTEANALPKNFPVCGVKALQSDNPARNWVQEENQYARRQLTWFAKQPGIKWLKNPSEADKLVRDWYNSS